MRPVDYFILLAVVAAVSAGVGAWVAGRRRPPSRSAPDAPRDMGTTPRREVRALALDAVSEAVLVVAPDGRVTDANSAALQLFDRHRAVLEGAWVSALRTLEVRDERPEQVAEERSLWSGEAWVRQSDGSVRLCLTRLVPVRDERGVTVALVECYRDVLKDGVMGDELRDLLYGIRQDDSLSSSPDPRHAVARDLQALGIAFRDLDRVVREYERLLPTLAAFDATSEAIAGSAVRVREASGARDITSLLAAVPDLLARLRDSVDRATRPGS